MTTHDFDKILELIEERTSGEDWQRQDDFKWMRAEIFARDARIEELERLLELAEHDADEAVYSATSVRREAEAARRAAHQARVDADERIAMQKADERRRESKREEDALWTRITGRRSL